MNEKQNYQIIIVNNKLRANQNNSKNNNILINSIQDKSKELTLINQSSELEKNTELFFYTII